MNIKKHLFVVEGSQAEPAILKSILEKYGFTVEVKSPIRIDKTNNELITDFSIETLESENDVVVIAQGPRSRIDHLIEAMGIFDCFENYFFESETPFANVFLLYDVDHTSNENLIKMAKRFNDQSTGLFVFDCPCVEVLSEPDRTDELIIYEHFEEYKKELNKKCDITHVSTIQFIIDNFEGLVVRFLDKNVKETKSNNVLEHIDRLIPIVNERNVRTPKACSYRFFTTTIYVAISILLDLTREFDNYCTVRDFFLSFSRKKEG